MSATCTVEYIDHVGIVVKDIEATMKFFQDVFQISPGEIEVLSDQGVRATLLAVGQTRLELLEAPISRQLHRSVSWNAVGRGSTTWPLMWTISPRSWRF